MKCALLISALLGAANGEWTEEWSAELRHLSSNDSNSSNVTLAPAENATTLVPTTLAPVDNTTLPPATTLVPTTLVPTTLVPTTLVPTTLVPTTLAPTTLAATTLAATTLAATTLASGATAAPTTTAPVTTTPSPVVVKSDLKVAFPPAAKTALMAAGNEQKLAAVTKAVGSVNFKTYCEGLVVTRAFESVAECKQAFTTSGNGNPVEVTMTEQVFGGDAAAKPHTDLDLTGFSRRRLASHNSDKIVNEFTLTVKAPDAKAVASFKAQTETLQAALTTKLNNATETAARFSSIKTIAEAAPGGTALFSAAGLLANVTVASLTTEAVSAPPTGGDLPPAAVSSAATVAMSAAASLIMGALFLF